LKKDLKTPDDRFESATKRTRGSAKASVFPPGSTFFCGLMMLLPERGQPLLLVPKS